MKNYIILVLSAAMLTACDKDSQQHFTTSTQERVGELMEDFDGRVDMDAFVADVQRGVWMIDHYDITYTNGETWDGRDIIGATYLHYMMLFPDGTCRIFLSFDFSPLIPILYQEIQWSIVDWSGNRLGLYSAQIEEDAKTAKYDQYAARTTMELLYYRDGVFIMQGMQPYASWGGLTSKGIYKDYCTVVGHIATDQATVDEYLSYLPYKKENPDLFR